MNQKEKVYHLMQVTGAFSLAMGIVIIVAGVTVGVGNIIGGARLLKKKNEITF